MYNGIINIYKEKGFTSHDVVAKMRGICKQKKIGHTGTLDPDAVGVLPVCLGSGTKLCDMLTDKDKEYVAELLLGVETDTQDISGQVLRQSEPIMDEDAVREAVLSFQGDYMQIPPEEDRSIKEHCILVDLKHDYKHYEHYREGMKWDVYTRSIR